MDLKEQKFLAKYGGKTFSDKENRVGICTIHSCEYLEQELKSDKPKTGIFYFKLAHYLSTRNQQLKLLDGMKFRYGVNFRKTTNKTLLRIVFPEK